MNEVRNIQIGFELKRDTSQLCYFDRRSGEPVSVPTKTGTSLYEFPTELCRMRDRDTWHFGMEARVLAKDRGGFLIEDVLGRAMTTEAFFVGRTLMEPWELLSVFFRESLKLLGLHDPVRAVQGLMITTPVLSGVLVGNIRKALEALGFTREQYLIQDRLESFYYYCMSQKSSVWVRNTALIEFSGDEAVFYAMRENRKTRPALVTIEKKAPVRLSAEKRVRDLEFLEYATSSMGDESYSALFITGEGFDREWARRALEQLVKGNRHVFYGSNLFVRGACYAALERTETHLLKNRLYLGADKVRSKVSIEVITGGQTAFYPLVEPGTNWFENTAECQLILDDRDYLELTVNRMDGSGEDTHVFLLPDLPKRPNRTTRIRFRAECTSPEVCELTAEDLGFGDLFPASHMIWHDTIEI